MIVIFDHCVMAQKRDSENENRIRMDLDRPVDAETPRKGEDTQEAMGLYSPNALQRRFRVLLLFPRQPFGRDPSSVGSLRLRIRMDVDLLVDAETTRNARGNAGQNR